MTLPKEDQERVDEFQIVCPHTSPHCEESRCFGACSQDIYVDWLIKTLQQKNAEAEAMVRAERERIAALCYQLETDGEEMYWLIFNSPETENSMKNIKEGSVLKFTGDDIEQTVHKCVVLAVCGKMVCTKSINSDGSTGLPVWQETEDLITFGWKILTPDPT